MIDEYIEELTRLYRKYKSIYASLKDALDMEEYAKLYQKSDDMSNRTTKSRVKK